MTTMSQTSEIAETTNTPIIFGTPTGDPIYLDDLQSFVDSGEAAQGPVDLGAYLGLKMDSSAESGKWSYVSGYYGARNGELLYASEKINAPTLVFDPKVTGYHAIHVVGFNPKGRQLSLYVRLDNEPHWTPLRMERHEPAYESMFFKIANLTDRKIEIANFGYDACLDHIRLVPVAGPATLPDKRGELVGILDFADDADRSKPRELAGASAVERHLEMGYDLVAWKAYAVRCEYHTKTPGTEIRGLTSKHDSFDKSDDLAGSSLGIGGLLEEYDTMRQAADHAKKIGQRIFGWARISNEFSRMDHQFSPTTPFHKQHPEKVMQYRTGQATTKISFAYPEVRQHKVDILCEIASYGMDGIFIDVLRHPPMVLFDQPLVDQYIEKTGKDPREFVNDGDEDWLRFRADAFTQFLREAKAALAESRGEDVPMYIRTVDQPWQNLIVGCDVDVWLDEGLFEGIVFGQHCATAENYPHHIDLRPYVERSAGRTKVIGQTWRYGSAHHAEALAKQIYDQGGDGVALYESNAAVAIPSMRDASHRFNRPELLCKW